MSLSEFLKEEIKKSGLNKTQFAQKMSDMHPTELARVLASSTYKPPSKNVLEKLSKGLGMSVDQLIDICHSKDTVVSTAVKDDSNNSVLEGFYPEIEARAAALYKTGSGETGAFSPEYIADTLCNLRNDIFAPHPEYSNSPENLREILKAYPKSTKIFYIEEGIGASRSIRIVGDWSIVFFPVKNGEVMAKTGSFKNKTLSLRELASMTMPGEYCGYILNMAMENRYNSYEYTPKLVESFLRQMEEYAKYGFCIRNLYVNVYDRDVGFFKALGFYELQNQVVVEGQGQTNIPRLYKMDNFPRDFVFLKGKTILEHIQELYGE